MSDRLSPENLGKNLFIIHEAAFSGNSESQTLDDWNMYLNEGEKESWSIVAESFCKSLKEAEEDS